VNASRRSLFGLVLLVMGVSAASQWWAGHHDRQLGAQVAALAQPGDIRMLASETCSICAMARTWFTLHGVSYSQCEIERDAGCRRDFEATGSPGTPVLLVRGQPQVGFDPQRLRDALQPRG
jgi:glutaredoxin